MQQIVEILRDYPFLAIFLVIGLGFWVGRLRIGSFQIGNVTAVLIFGVLIGQLDIPVGGTIKMFFFLMFLFSVGYSVGPDFFRSLKGSGLRQVLFAVTMSFVCFLSTLAMAYAFSYNKGEAVGLFGGAQTCSSILGVGSEAIARLPISDDARREMLDIIPVCYAVTYVFGTLGTVIILSNFGPKFLGGLDYVRAKTKELEKAMGGSGKADPADVPGLKKVSYRAFRLEDPFFANPRTVAQTEEYLRANGVMGYIDLINHNGEMLTPRYDRELTLGDEVVIAAPKHYIVHAYKHLGPEVTGAAILHYSVKRIGVVVSKKDFTGVPLQTLRRRPFMHSVIIRDAYRDGKLLPLDGDTVFRKGDRLTLMGRDKRLNTAIDSIGYSERPTVSSDLMFVGLAVFIGGLLGALTIWVGSIPLSFGTSGGALIAGLVFGWLRSKRPSYGYISPGALWIMNNLGLNVFIAVVGITAAPTFVSGIRTIGPMLFVAGAIATILPLLFGLWFGHKVLKFNPAITLGCCAGTRTCTAALGAVQTTLNSTMPTIGYTTTYAVANVMLIIWGSLLVVFI